MRSRSSVAPGPVRSTFESIANIAKRNGTLKDLHFFDGPGYVGLDATTGFDDETIRQRGEQLIRNNLHRSELYPDAWQPAIIRNPANTEAELAKVAGAKYSYRQLDNYTDLIQRTMQGVPETSTVSARACLQEQIYLDYSQQRLAQYGYDPSKLKDILNAQNITLPGGSLEVGPQDLNINPSGLFPDAPAIGNVIIGVSSSNSPVYLRDLVDISRTYQSPPTFLNYLTWREAERAVDTQPRHLARPSTCAQASRSTCSASTCNEKLEGLAPYLPDDLVIVPTSSQPVQVKEQIDLFMDALYEAIAPGRHRLADRLLGVALGGADGHLDSHHAGHDLRHHLHARHRHPAGVGGFADHRAGTAGGRSRRGGRFHQAHAGRGTAAHRRALARSDEDCDCHPVRDHHQHRRLPAVPDDHGNDRRVHLQPAGGDDGRADMRRGWRR